MRSRLLGLVVLAAIALPAAATSGPYNPPRATLGAGTLHTGTVVAFGAAIAPFPALLPCPTECPGAIGHVTTRSAEGHLWQGQVTCLAISGTEAFMGLVATHSDLLVDAAAYAREADPREMGPAPGNRFALLRGVQFDCHSERVRDHLRAEARPLDGVVKVTHVCEYCD